MHYIKLLFLLPTASSDLDTDFSADESGVKLSKRAPKPSTKAFAFTETQEQLAEAEAASATEEVGDETIAAPSNDFNVDPIEDYNEHPDEPVTPSLKLKINLSGLAPTPPVQQPSFPSQRPPMPHWGASPKLPKNLNKSVSILSL